MEQKRNPGLKVMQPLSEKEKKVIIDIQRKKKIKKIVRVGFFAVMMFVGTWLLINNHPYTLIRQTHSYDKTFTENSRYTIFQNRVVRYNRNGVALLNEKNEEIWLQPSQFSNPSPDMNEEAFAIGDIEGNMIQVFSAEGLRGEIETPLPIEKFSVSNQGIVSVLMQSNNEPQICTYDAAGNLLVENKISVNTYGYPVGMDMSIDGTKLAVSYVNPMEEVLKSTVVYYDYGETGNQDNEYKILTTEYADELIPEVFFMDNEYSVVVGDKTFYIYKGMENPKQQTKVSLSQEIHSVFHTDTYIGFVLLNQEKSGFEVRLYNQQGRMVMSHEIDGEYNHVQMYKKEIVLYEGSRLCILTDTGVERFNGNLKEPPFAIVQMNGRNRYIVMNENELQMMKLVY